MTTTELTRCGTCNVSPEERTCYLCGHTATVVDCGHHAQPAEIAADPCNGEPICASCFDENHDWDR